LSLRMVLPAAARAASAMFSGLERLKV
jgi:hypothetical protein